MNLINLARPALAMVLLQFTANTWGAEIDIGHGVRLRVPDTCRFESGPFEGREVVAANGVLDESEAVMACWGNYDAWNKEDMAIAFRRHGFTANPAVEQATLEMLHRRISTLTGDDLQTIRTKLANPGMAKAVSKLLSAFEVNEHAPAVGDVVNLSGTYALSVSADAPGKGRGSVLYLYLEDEFFEFKFYFRYDDSVRPLHEFVMADGAWNRR